METLVAVRCAVCGGAEQVVVCSAAEVRAHQEYLLRFHRRRLRPGPDGRPPEDALADRAHFTQDYATDIVACRGCGLVFRSPRPPEGEITDAYEGDRYGPERLAALFQAQRELYQPRARQLRRRLRGRSPVRVVEVGSFVGGFLAAGEEQGWEMLGVDPGEEVGEFCRSQGRRVFPGTLAEAPLQPATVDVVAIWNTFDQLPDPEPTLAAARHALRPNGILALRIPNGDCFRLLAVWEPRLPPRLRGWLHSAMAWNNLLAFPYLYGYSLRTLDWLLSWHGMLRIAAVPDTLPRLADAQTRWWAAWEERALKALWRVAFRLALPNGLIIPDGSALAPWLDVYYRKAVAETAPPTRPFAGTAPRQGRLPNSSRLPATRSK